MVNCPFCMAANACTANNQCWCFMVEIPDSLLSLVPESYQAKACICQACLEQYTKDPNAFIESLNTQA
ncbi:cysteine-rich CWC family protein [Marinomonas pollencensis]|uniref:cysteine-rich CWC family protein n=1 Tax=Marinomonas pollencensis TaxID=491954 RepID=UPI000E239BF2